MKRLFTCFLLSAALLAGSCLTASAAPQMRSDGTVFDAAYYARQNPDVVAVTGTDADALYQHYQNYGRAEGRKAVSDIAQIFDPEFYAETYPDVAAVLGTDAAALYQHYVDYGKAEGRRPCADSRDWSSVMSFPTEQEIKDFNETSAERSPYLAAWIGIDSNMRYSEYSIDFKADYLPNGTYFCCANAWMDLSSLSQQYPEVNPQLDPSFYGGLQMRKPEEGSGSILSFWDIPCRDASGETTVIHAKLVYPEGETENTFDHEGNGVNYLPSYPWEEGCWYRMLFQCSRSEENGHTLLEQWVCNLETEEWTKLAAYDTGLTDSCFVGSMAVFLENYLIQHSGDIRTAEFKNIRIHPVGQDEWLSVRKVTMKKDYYAGSYCYGADDECFWMITTGLENRSLQQCGQSTAYTVTSGAGNSPYAQ